MKRAVYTVVIIIAMLFVGCGKEKVTKQGDSFTNTQPYRVEKMIYASPQKSCSCVVDVEDIDTMIEIGETKNAMLYNVLVKTGKILLVKSDTKVACYYSESYKNFVPVVFMEGEYKGRRAYVFPSRLEEID